MTGNGEVELGPVVLADFQLIQIILLVYLYQYENHSKRDLKLNSQ